MMVMILENVKPSLRGELSRWLLEPHPGVFVGHVNAMVRERLWQKACRTPDNGGVIQIWSCNSEQHFDMRICGKTRRKVVDMEGIKLILRPH